MWVGNILLLSENSKKSCCSLYQFITLFTTLFGVLWCDGVFIFVIFAWSCQSLVYSAGKFIINFFGKPLSQATVSIISYLQRPLLAIPIGYARDSILINSPLSSFRNIKTASLIHAFLKSCSCHANIALLVMLYRMLYILCVCSACIVLVCGFM